MQYTLSDIPGFNDLLKPDFISNSIILKLNKMQSRTNNANYSIICYDKNMLSSDLIRSYGLCRSVIVNSNNKVVSFAPPKSIPADLFMNNYTSSSSDIMAQEFVEGTMINVFFDPSIGLTGSWEIATRNTVGATSTFYKSSSAKTFKEMFKEAAITCHLDVNQLEQELCYSFVLQHPENRIVVPFEKPNLYLVGVYTIKQDDNTIDVLSYDPQEYKYFFQNELQSLVQFPDIYDFNEYSELIERFGSMNSPYDVVGVVLYNEKTGERTKIRNPVYEQVRNLRGNQPKLQYQYLCLRKEGRVKDFLKFYPENKKEFSTFRDQVHLFTDTLYANYVSCYIKKEKPLIQFSEQYRTHMYNIHQHYMNELREKKLFINNTFVQKYVNELHPSLLMYCLNYHMRKRHIDILNKESTL
jgi:hypothetical protein